MCQRVEDTGGCGVFGGKTMLVWEGEVPFDCLKRKQWGTCWSWGGGRIAGKTNSTTSGWGETYNGKKN